MSSRLRPLLVVLLAVAGLAAPPAAHAVTGSGCSPTAPTFCVSYGAEVLSSLTGQPTTQSLAPVDLRLAFQNTSSGYRDEVGQPRWLDRLSATVLSSGTIRPVVTGSASLPDGLLVGGDPDGSLCSAGADSTFSGCAAGRGVAFAKVSSLFVNGIVTATYGVKQVRNVKATSHFAQYRITLGVCLQYGSSSCFTGEKVQSQDITVDLPAAGQPLTLDFQMPTNMTVSGITVERFTVHTLALQLRGRSSRLASGAAVPAVNVVRLPATCGTVSAGATLTDVAGDSVSLPQSFTVTGCTRLTAGLDANPITYGQNDTLRGRLVDSGTGAGIAGRTLVVRRCPVGGSCLTSSVTTGSTGAYALRLTPTKNTTYTVTDPTSQRSASRSLLVRSRVSLEPSRARMPSGGSVTLSGVVGPSHAGSTVLVQRQVSGVWRTIAQATLSSRSTYGRVVSLTGARGTRAVLRVVLAGHRDHAAGTSPVRTVLFD